MEIDRSSSLDKHDEEMPRSQTLERGTRDIRVAAGRVLKATPVYDTYWRFAAKRQNLFMRRVSGATLPWTDDPILASHRFTNVYRASDRVSQYLIRQVIYNGSQQSEEVFFRALLFKFFNRADTWRYLVENIGIPTWKGFKYERYAQILDDMLAQGDPIYSAAYIVPSPHFGSPRKHRNHLRLLEHMMTDGAPRRIARAQSLQQVFEVLRQYPSLGDFLAFQFAIDLNYSEVIDFPEMQFVVPGPGARDGIHKCFADFGGLSETDVIRAVTDRADEEFKRVGVEFQTLWGRSLQLIDCQNLFCEVGKYSRVVHPDVKGTSNRVRIKQKFKPNPAPLPQFYPPKWKLTIPSALTASEPVAHSRPRQQSLPFLATRGPRIR